MEIAGNNVINSIQYLNTEAQRMKGVAAEITRHLLSQLVMAGVDLDGESLPKHYTVLKSPSGNWALVKIVNAEDHKYGVACGYIIGTSDNKTSSFDGMTFCGIPVVPANQEQSLGFLRDLLDGWLNDLDVQSAEIREKISYVIGQLQLTGLSFDVDRGNVTLTNMARVKGG